jgi:hypothetical protein
MKIDKRLNFVIPIERSDGSTAYVHAEPIREEVFDAHFMIIGQAFAEMYSSGLGLFAGPRVAAKLLKKIAIAAEKWDGEDGVERNLFGEMRRLSHFIAPGVNGGWSPVPLDEAAAKGLISAEDVSEVENALAFFTVASSMHKRSELPVILAVVSRIWGAQTSSLNSTRLL